MVDELSVGLFKKNNKRHQELVEFRSFQMMEKAGGMASVKVDVGRFGNRDKRCIRLA